VPSLAWWRKPRRARAPAAILAVAVIATAIAAVWIVLYGAPLCPAGHPPKGGDWHCRLAGPDHLEWRDNKKSPANGGPGSLEEEIWTLDQRPEKERVFPSTPIALSVPGLVIRQAVTPR
jgi:hypothetical protein